jgi:hypothetical protein
LNIECAHIKRTAKLERPHITVVVVIFERDSLIVARSVCLFFVFRVLVRIAPLLFPERISLRTRVHIFSDRAKSYDSRSGFCLVFHAVKYCDANDENA